MVISDAFNHLSLLMHSCPSLRHTSWHVLVGEVGIRSCTGMVACFESGLLRF